HKPTLVWGQRYHPAFERTMVFLEYSRKEFETEQRIKELEQKRKLQRARVTAIVFGSLMVVALMFLVFAIYQQTEAKRQEALAVANAAEAVAQKDLAEAATIEAVAQKEVAEKARAAAVSAQAAEAEQRAAAEQRRLEAEAAEARAKVQEQLAVKNAKLAQDNEQQARIAEADARAAEAESKRQQYLAIAKAMAIKSIELNNNPEQESIIAQQAYNFNTANKGYEYDNDIYRGLYYALKNQPEPHPLTKSLEAHTKGAARALVTKPNIKYIYSGGSDGKIIQWDYSGTNWVVDKEIAPDRTRSSGYQIYSMDLSPDGKVLIAGGLYFADANNNYVELYDLSNTGAAPKIIKGFKQAAENITFTPDGKGFYARDNAGYSIKYSDMQTAKEVISSKEKLVAISMNKQGTKIAGAGDNGNVYVWDLKNNYEMVTYKMPDTRLTAVAFSPDGSQLVVGNERGRVWIYNNRILVRELTGHTSAIEDIKYNQAGNFMATASKDYSIRLWNTKRLTEAPTLLSEHDWVWSVVFSPDDEQLMAGIHSVQETVVGKVDQTIHAYPTKINTMADLLCGYTERNMNREEWNYYVGEDLKYEKTCPNLPSNDN
ncbi:MAG: High-affnity carbon uptake protein Hat/HatR, partial [Cyclobacteriaceae bacterium]